jgi:hypothetical protein
LRRVPEPQPVLLLGFLQAMQQAHDESGRWVYRWGRRVSVHSCRWMDAQGAVVWMLGKVFLLLSRCGQWQLTALSPPPPTPSLPCLLQLCPPSGQVHKAMSPGCWASLEQRSQHDST